MAPYPPPTDLSAIETCWSAIEAFADLESTAAAAQTCRALRRVLIADGSQLKASHFEFEVDGGDPFTPGTPASAQSVRRPHFVARALDALHFPSLRTLCLAFPTERRDAPSPFREGDPKFAFDEAVSAAFLILASKVASAHKLESLHLSAERFIATERKRESDLVYEILADNLSRCRRLRDLAVTNEYLRQGGRARSSMGLLLALLPTIRKKRLKDLTIIIGGALPYGRYNGIDRFYLVRELFGAILSSEQLQSLDLSMSVMTTHMAALNAAAMIHGGAKPSRLRRLRLSYHYRDSDLSLRGLVVTWSAALVLDHFSCCDGLEEVVMNLPPQCWEGENSAQALRRLLGRKPCLASVILGFSLYSDTSGEIVKAITEGIALNLSEKTLQHLSITNLTSVDEEAVRQLKLSLIATGMVVEVFDDRSHSNRHVITLIATRPREGRDFTDTVNMQDNTTVSK